eukprot:12339586-Prorocentrum_lima.AAC.1
MYNRGVTARAIRSGCCAWRRPNGTPRSCGPSCRSPLLRCSNHMEIHEVHFDLVVSCAAGAG